MNFDESASQQQFTVAMTDVSHLVLLPKISQYLKQLPFNGELVLFDLQEYIKNNAAGVVIPEIVKAETKWIDVALDDYGSFENINVRKIPVSGYFKIA